LSPSEPQDRVADLVPKIGAATREKRLDLSWEAEVLGFVDLAAAGLGQEDENFVRQNLVHFAERVFLPLAAGDG
jgi:hypothetical protein